MGSAPPSHARTLPGRTRSRQRAGMDAGTGAVAGRASTPTDFTFRSSVARDMAWWIKVAGTGESAFTQERWDARRARLLADGSADSMFPRRPRTARGDLLVVYASGSAAAYGEARFVAIERVVSDEPKPSGHERWRWKLETELVIAVDWLADAPALREIGVSPKSLRQHSHIRLTPEQGRRA